MSPPLHEFPDGSMTMEWNVMLLYVGILGGMVLPLLYTDVVSKQDSNLFRIITAKRQL